MQERTVRGGESQLQLGLSQGFLGEGKERHLEKGEQQRKIFQE